MVNVSGRSSFVRVDEALYVGGSIWPFYEGVARPRFESRSLNKIFPMAMSYLLTVETTGQYGRDQRDQHDPP